MDIQIIVEKLTNCWSAETAHEGSGWTPKNPARGQCAISSLLVQDLLGGELVRFEVEYRGTHEKHFANVSNGALIDVTRSQYGAEGVFRESIPDLTGFSSRRERLLSDLGTRRRYELLKERFYALP